MTDSPAYDREVLVEVITHHGRDGIRGCRCGWAQLGHRHPEHVADVYERTLAERKTAVVQEQCSNVLVSDLGADHHRAFRCVKRADHLGPHADRLDAGPFVGRTWSQQVGVWLAT